MYKALFYKEWLKTRRVAILTLVVLTAMAIFTCLKVHSLVETRGVEQLWLMMILKDVSMLDSLAYLPLLGAVAIAAAQMAPEMAHKRLKLTLHLPCPITKLVGTMLGSGLIQLIVIFAIQLAIIAVYYAHLLPAELVWRSILTLMPWYAAALAGYLFVAAVALEGTWFMRALTALLGVACVSVFFYKSNVMDAYSNMISITLIIIAIPAALAFGAVGRFKEGLQD